MLEAELWLLGMLVMVLVIYWREERRTLKESVPVARVQYFWTGAERRDEERVNLVFKARYQVTKDPAKIQRESLTDDVSSRGLKLIAYEKLNVNEEIELEIEIPPHEVLRCRGKVVWVKDLPPDEGGSREKRSFVIGLCFTQLSPIVADRLASFLNESPSNATAAAA